MDIKNLLKFLEQGKNPKRFVLQAAGRIFDPLVLASPFTVRLKCLFQELWQRLDNPPDILTRGISVDCLLGNVEWWTGLSFLFDKDIPHHAPICEVPEDTHSSELKKITVD
ncbi:hypothetical protein AVEN_220872-1 [Araneus ventricosus]|uniref:Uncharacterized protein n=1 Tax=Araneus ventricosus TaxID=182803 RepID=A0A4Y2L0R6_ARAVE|nr:hypothetical protein AVEN_220872-1 [Araneus ventricosus]